MTTTNSKNKIREQILENIKELVKDYSHQEVFDLFRYISFGYYTDEPSELQRQFVCEVFGEKEWNNLVLDFRLPQYFNRFNLQGLLEDVKTCFHSIVFFNYGKLIQERKEIEADNQMLLEFTTDFLKINEQ
jgi:hypothetical protein